MFGLVKENSVPRRKRVIVAGGDLDVAQVAVEILGGK